MMTALHREIVSYLCDALENRNLAQPNVLVAGHDSELIASLLPTNYSAKNAINLSELNQEVATGKKYDGVIFNEVFQNFSLDQIEKSLNNLLKATRLGGHVVVRQHLGVSKWNLAQYANLFHSYRKNDADTEKSFGFNILWEQSLRDTIFSRHDWHDHCWLLTTSEFPYAPSLKNANLVSDHLDPVHYLDYNQRDINKHEWLCGEGFLSWGGETQNEKFLSELNLKVGQMVLDIGSGLGGCAFQIAKNYGAHVIGVDVEPNHVSAACDRATIKQDTRVRFITTDIDKIQFPANSFDVVYSKESLCHVSDKLSLFEKIFKWLKPGGRAFIVDCMLPSNQQRSEKLLRFLSYAQLMPWSIDQYLNAAKQAGFTLVEDRDATDQFRGLVEAEMRKAKENKHDFCQLFSEENFASIIDLCRIFMDEGWKWGIVIADKLQSK